MLDVCADVATISHPRSSHELLEPPHVAVESAMDRLAKLEPQLADRVRGFWAELSLPSEQIDLGISSLRRELRWVAPIAANEPDPRASLGNALGLARRLGFDVPQQAAYDLHRIAALQHGMRDACAVSLGGRHRAPRKDVLSLCLELPPQCASTIWTVLGRRGTRARQLLGGLGTPRFLRFDLDRSEGFEIFCQTHTSYADVPELLTERAGFSRVKGKNPLRAAMNSWSGQSNQDVRTSGVSVAINRFDEPSAVAVFTSAAQLFGDDDSTHDRIAALAVRQRWLGAGMHEALTAGQSALHTGAVSFTASRVGRIEQRVSLVASGHTAPTVNPLSAFAA